MISLKVISRLQSLSRVRDVGYLPLTRAYNTDELMSEHLSKERKNYEKSINQVTLLGRAGGDPVKKGTLDHPCVLFSLATHTNYRYESGEYLEKTDWHKIVIFKPSLRDMVFSYLKKGQRVYVSGRITYGYVTDNNVQKSNSSIVADEVIFFPYGESET